MALIYITGIPGSGKSTIRKELQRRGFTAYGGAEDGLAAFFDNETGAKINEWVNAKERTPEWNKRHTWKIPRVTIEGLKRINEGKLAFICAVTRNDKDELWSLFDKVIALTIDEGTLRHRLATRTNNDVGKSKHELEILIDRQKISKDEYRQLGAHLVDATHPINQVIEEILKITKTPNLN